MRKFRNTLLSLGLLLSTSVLAQVATLPTPLFYQDGANAVVTFNNLALQVTYYLQMRNDRSDKVFADAFLKKLGDMGPEWDYSDLAQDAELVAIDPWNYACVAKGAHSSLSSSRYLGVSNNTDPDTNSIKDLFSSVDAQYPLSPVVERERNIVLGVALGPLGAGIALIVLAQVPSILWKSLLGLPDQVFGYASRMSCHEDGAETAPLIATPGEPLAH